MRPESNVDMTESEVAAIAEDEWPKVQTALENPEWDFRTVAGIAKETGLSPEHVELLLHRNRSRIRQTLSRDRRVIYTLKSRLKRLREILADIHLFASQ